MNVLSTRIAWSQKCSGITKNELMGSEKIGWIKSKRTIQFQRKGTKANPGRMTSMLQSTKVQRNKVSPKKSSPLDCKETKPVTPKGNQPWIFIGRTDAEASKLWPPDAKSWLTGKDSNAGKDWGQEEKGTTENDMVGWHHWLDGSEFEQARGVGDGQGSLACCSLASERVRHNRANELNWNNSVQGFQFLYIFANIVIFLSFFTWPQTF